ncbi:MAG: hypothetical protein ABJM58_04695 [Alteripontixanthobacter sp.]
MRGRHHHRNGTTARAESFYAHEDGSTGALGELIFEGNRGKTRCLGDGRVAGRERAVARSATINVNSHACREVTFNTEMAA